MVTITDSIQKLVDTSPKLKLTDVQLLLQDVYESGYGIYNHASNSVDNSRPLALVAMHWAENASEGSVLYERIEQFRERNVYQTFGLSLTEFLDLPRDICIKILESCSKKQATEHNVVDTLQQSLDNSRKKS